MGTEKDILKNKFTLQDIVKWLYSTIVTKYQDHSKFNWCVFFPVNVTGIYILHTRNSK